MTIFPRNAADFGHIFSPADANRICRKHAGSGRCEGCEMRPKVEAKGNKKDQPTQGRIWG